MVYHLVVTVNVHDTIKPSITLIYQSNVFYSSMIILLPTLMASYTILGFREKRWYSTSLRRLQWLKKNRYDYHYLIYMHACIHSGTIPI